MRENYLGLDGLVGLPPTPDDQKSSEPAQGTEATSRGSVDGVISFAGERARALPRSRRHPRSVATLVISTVVLVAVIVTVAVLGFGRGTTGGRSTGTAATSTPGRSVESAMPSVAASPGASSPARPSLKAHGSGARPEASQTQLPVDSQPPSGQLRNSGVTGSWIYSRVGSSETISVPAPRTSPGT